MKERIPSCLRTLGLFRPGDRIAIAVSGGADSVALLRALTSLREEFGLVLSVCHLHHGIRGAEADSDLHFVAELASSFSLPCHSKFVDVPAYALAHKIGLEAAAREVRYDFFRTLLKSGHADKIATAHTQNDQAETILMRLLRGTGNTGLAGIPASAKLFPSDPSPTLIRPFLSIRRLEIERYLQALGQTWREDSTNANVGHTRNRIRHELLPLIADRYNPAIVEVLSLSALAARDEETFWAGEVNRSLREIVTSVDVPNSAPQSPSEPVADRPWGISLSHLTQHSAPLQRRLIRAAAQQHGIALDALHTQSLMDLIPAGAGAKSLALPKGWIAIRAPRQIQLRREVPLREPARYGYSLTVPGEIRIPEISLWLRSSLFSSLPSSQDPPVQPDPYEKPSEARDPGYNGLLTSREQTLLVRNWAPGDRFCPAHHKRQKKVKSLLQERQVHGPDRELWPVVIWETEVIWLRGYAMRPVPWTAEGRQMLQIEEVGPHSENGGSL